MSKKYHNIQDMVYDTLRTNILNFTLVPGTIMSTQDTATRLQVSRTPVREAFIRLQRDGLVQILPQRETMVSLIDMNRVNQERFLRMHLEPSVIRLFMQKMEPSHLQKLHSLIEKQLTASVNNQFEELHQYDNEFHRIFYDGAGQPLLWEFMNQSSTHYQRIRLLSLRYGNISRNIVLQHQFLLRALESGQEDMIFDIQHQHLSKLDVEEEILRKENPGFFLEQTPKDPILLP